MESIRKYKDWQPTNKHDIEDGWDKTEELVNHPNHYGGEDNPYEAIKVIENWGMNFNLGNTLKYLSRVGKKDDSLQDLKKALWYLQREIETLEK